MNERIKQLAEQAGIWRQHYDIGEESPERLEKFAELIVKECITKMAEEFIEHSMIDVAIANTVEHFEIKE